MILFKPLQPGRANGRTSPRPLKDKGRLRSHIGILPHGPQEAALWQRAKRLATTPGNSLVIMGTPLDAKSVWWTQEDDNVLVADKIDLTSATAVSEIEQLGATHVIIPTLELSPADHTAEQQKQYTQNLEELLWRGFNIEASMSLLAIFKVGEVLNPAMVWPVHTALTGDFLRSMIGEYVLYDTTPETLIAMYQRQELKLPAWLESQAPHLLTLPNLSRLREAILMWVGHHVSDVARKNNPGLSPLPQPVASNGLKNPTIVKLILWPLANILSLLAVYLFWKQGLVGPGAVSLILLVPVVLTAMEFNVRVAAANALMMCLGFALLVAEPVGSLSMSRPEQIGTLFVLLGCSMLVSWQAHRQRRRLLEAQSSSQNNRLWLRLVYDLSLAEDLISVARAAEQNLLRNLTLPGVFLDTSLKPFSGEAPALFEEDIAAAQSALTNGGTVRPTANSQWLWCPLMVQQETIGVMGTKWPVGQEPDFAALDQLFNYANVVAISLQRHRLLDNLDDVSQQMDREALRASLLSSVSHDLKTPLVGIIGSLSTLEQVGDGLPPAERHELINSARTEAERLHHIIHNLLELTKLESGHLQPNRETTDLGPLVENVEKRIQRTYPALDLTLGGDKQMPEVQVDAILLEQVLYNLMDNAIKYSGQTALELAVTDSANETQITLDDHGQGVPLEFRERVFDKFYRLEQTDKRTAGSGLGLAICRAIVRAHGGKIELADRPDGEHGLRVVITLPHYVSQSKTKVNLKESIAA